MIRRALLDSFRLRLAALFGGLFLASALLAAVCLDQVLSDRIMLDQGEAMSSLAGSIAKAIEANLRERHREVLLLAQTPTYIRAPLDGDELRQSLERTKQAYKYYAWIGIADTQGKIVSAAGGMLVGQSAAKRPWFIHGLHAPFVGDIHQAVLLAKLLPASSAQGEPLRFVDFASPVYDPSGKLRGVLATHALWDWVEDIIRERLPPKSGLETFIVDRQGNLLSPFEAVGKMQAPAPMPAAQTFRLGPWPGGGDYLYSESRVQEAGLGWRVIVRQPKQQALAALNRLRGALMLLGLAASALLMAAVYRLATSFSRPLEQLAGTAQRVGGGEEDADWAIRGGTQELRQLSEAMRNMTSSLLARKQQLADVNANLEQMVADRTEQLRESNHLLLRKAAELALQARHDALTNLHNRMAANEQLQEEHLRYKRTGAPYAVLLLDVDHFKRVNDTFGHDAGDRVLRHIADTLRNSARATDFVARYGGEEFLLLLPETDAAGAAVLAEKIRAAVEQSQAPDVGRITISIGLATSDAADAQPEATVKRADLALYRAKAGGRNRVETETTA
ncbi:diguanylate cyclase [Chromobacterium piscinae]|uniref:sensor domain-containing diguanylate cyclase n=1 Tax=Chromobacterium piscinae TaxID=686831 RepID=UPI001C8C3236|nr:sensor domain-containing diguanylate cyclase [Chromobacterium piscinae]MBX9295882.1 diguanylate cyclase [Chromobacterium vaccinii]MBX9346972.1 diguanylate cyclase [Chromobacterium vaccinii]MBX9356079.1 diguanylate cyclase [Chromobacterium vaccinii]MCD4505977.1 diguanylate cyclase [Chromobacterium piscinae]MCD5327227.1 diguanylate cyclase [Chromobacterium piscinae]